MRIRHLVLLGVASAGLAACGSSSEPTAPGDVSTGDPSYSVSVSGDRAASMHGITFTQRIANGFTEVDQAGKSQSINVVLILLATINVNPPQIVIGPQVNIGLMGNLIPGTYGVHANGSALGTRAEFYGSYSITNADSSRTQYDATDGTVTITSVSPKIQGTFSFHSSRSLLWPAHVAVNQSIPSSPASLDAAGSFVAKVP
ncbi:MAG TPA: hypothetical protein VK636_12260 [Gemmatimonadaceae bacterium]|nr:hypothetical protein [Gemmatimonadaceae bacterium]